MDGGDDVAAAGFPVGAKLKQLRLQMGISQRELARRADITNGNLSQIEKGAVSPSLVTLEKVLKALSMDLEGFFSPQSLRVPAVVRADDFVQLSKQGCHYKLMPVTEARVHPLSLMQQMLLPGASISTDWQVHEGALAAIVVSGELTLKLDGETSVLSPGDGFHFALHRRFLLQNLGTEPCTLVAVSLSWS